MAKKPEVKKAETKKVKTSKVPVKKAAPVPAIKKQLLDIEGLSADQILEVILDVEESYRAPATQALLIASIDGLTAVVDKMRLEVKKIREHYQEIVKG